MADAAKKIFGIKRIDMVADMGCYMVEGIADLAPISPDGFKRLQKPLRDARTAHAF